MSPTEEILHVAVCQAVAILNVAPEVAATEDGRRVRTILREALHNYANAVMDEPAKPGEVEHMKKLHRNRRAPGVGPSAQTQQGNPK
jgi:hypothetical protein